MSVVLSPSSTLARLTAAVLAGTVMICALAASLLSGLGGCGSDGGVAPSAMAERAIPAEYAALYRRAAAAYGVPWAVLAAIGAIESDHGRSTAPGVQTGVNAFGCCAGPMQFNLKDGPPSTWQVYRVDGDADGDMDPYDPPTRSRPRRAICARCSTARRATSTRPCSATTIRRRTSPMSSLGPAPTPASRMRR